MQRNTPVHGKSQNQLVMEIKLDLNLNTEPKVFKVDLFDILPTKFLVDPAILEGVDTSYYLVKDSQVDINGKTMYAMSVPDSSLFYCVLDAYAFLSFMGKMVAIAQIGDQVYAIFEPSNV